MAQLDGAEHADYETFCPGGYTRNLYDYYVELHASAIDRSDNSEAT